MTPGMLHIQRVIETGHIDAETESHLVSAFTRWHGDATADGTMLLRYLGLPTTSTKLRQAIRDYWLCVASDLLGGETTAARASILHDACRRFDGRVWERWKSLGAPPLDADEVSGCLYLARKAGKFPGQKQLQNILAEAFPGSNFHASGGN